MARILVVDDEDLVRASIGAVLSGAGYRVALACDGEDALRQFRAARFDLVITDIIMPRMEGLETVRALRDIGGGVKIVAISGCARTGSKFYLAAAKAMGVDAVLVKPFLPAELKSAVARILHTPVAVE